jgi:hypothetical protein
LESDCLLCRSSPFLSFILARARLVGNLKCPGPMRATCHASALSSARFPTTIVGSRAEYNESAQNPSPGFRLRTTQWGECPSYVYSASVGSTMHTQIRYSIAHQGWCGAMPLKVASRRSVEAAGVQLQQLRRIRLTNWLGRCTP